MSEGDIFYEDAPPLTRGGASSSLQILPAMAEGGLVFQLVNVFENQLINGLTRAGSVNLKTDLRA